MRLLLARHGESVWNASRMLQGGADVALSERGRAQAEALGRVLGRYRIRAAYASPLARARDTAAIALGGTDVDVTPVEALRELSLGAWEGAPVETIRAQDGDPYQAWVRAPHDHPPPGGEPLDRVLERVRGALERIAAAHRDDGDVLVVTHGGVISVYVCHLLGLEFNALWRLRVDNASLTVVHPPRLRTINDTAHLAPALRSTHLQRLAPAAPAPAGPLAAPGVAAS